MGVTFIARELKINPSTCFNILRTLAVYKMVDFDANTRTYRMGSGVLGLARGALDPDRANEMVRTAMSAIATEWGVTVSLWRRTAENRMTLIAATEAKSAIHIRMNLGTRLPLFAGALGRIQAGYSTADPDEKRRLFEQVVWQSPLSFEDFMAEAETARRTGEATDAGTLVRGALTMAVPVLREEEPGVVSMTVNASMFERQHGSAARKEIAKALKEVAHLLGQLPKN